MSRRRYELYLAFTKALARKDGWRFLLTDLGYMFLNPGPVLNASQLKDRWLEHIENARRRKASPEANLYISVPYCRFRCHYCHIYKAVPKNAAEVEGYTRRLRAEIAYFSDISDRLKFSHLYMGGGSPTLFSESQIRDLCGDIFKNFRFQEDGERTVEGHPADMTQGKLKALREGGFNAVSLGVQSLNADILRRVGRGIQTAAMVENAVDWSRRAGFENVKLDLMVGLQPGDGESVLSSFKALCALRPDEITIYLSEPTPYYLKRHWNGDLDAFERNLEDQRKWLTQAINWSDAHGFTGGKLGPAGGIGFERTDAASRRKGRYSSDILKPLQWMFTLGPNGVSYVYDALDQRLQYEGLPLEDNPQDNRFQSWELSPMDAMRLFVLECFGRGGSASEKEFQRMFHKTLKSVFGEALSRLKALGLVRWNEDGARLNRNLRWDERFAAAMFIFNHAWLVERLNRVLDVVPLRVNVGDRKYQLRAGYHAGGKAFSLKIPEPERPLDRKILGACRRKFQGLARESSTRDIFELREKYAVELGIFLERLETKLHGPRISCGQ